MWVYIVRRLLFLPVALVAVSLITFTLFHYGPGDPVRVMMGNKYNDEAAERIRDELGLNRPFFIQYADYMYGFFRGDFGESLRFIGQPVRELIVPKMWVSAQLSIAAMIISLGLGLPLGFYIAHKQGSWQDPTTVTISIVLASIPIMVTVPSLLWVGCLKDRPDTVLGLGRILRSPHRRSGDNDGYTGRRGTHAPDAGEHP